MNRKAVETFFADSAFLDLLVLRPLSHVRQSWELQWDATSERYITENESFASALNDLIVEVAALSPPMRYHDNEDRLAEYVRLALKWDIKKIGNRWVGADYDSIIEQGGFRDIDQKELLLAAAGRVHAAIAFKQHHFDDMEDGHQRMLGAVLAVILYHRAFD